MLGKTVLISGASAGIGCATAQLLSELGATLILNGRNEAALETTRQQLNGTDHQIAPFDMAETDHLAAWVTELSQKFGYLDGFVHCAGIQITRSVRTFDQQFLMKLCALI